MKRPTPRRKPPAFSVEREARASAGRTLRAATSPFGKRIAVQLPEAAVKAFLAQERRMPRFVNDGSFLRELGRLPEQMLPRSVRTEVERRLGPAGPAGSFEHVRFNLFSAWRSSPFQKSALVRFKADLQVIGIDAVFRGAGVPVVRVRAEGVRTIREAAPALIAGGAPDAFVARVVEALGPRLTLRLKSAAAKVTAAHVVWGTLDAPARTPDELLARLFDQLVWFGIVPHFDDVELHPEHVNLFDRGDGSHPRDIPVLDDPAACYRYLSRVYKRDARSGFLAAGKRSWNFDRMDRSLVSGWFPPAPPLDPDAEGCRAVMLGRRPQCLPHLIRWWTAVEGADFAAEATSRSKRFSLESQRWDPHGDQLDFLWVEKLPDRGRRLAAGPNTG